MNLGTYKIQSGQDLYYLSNLLYGSIDYVYTLIELNDFLTMDSDLNDFAGKTIYYNTDLVELKAYGIELTPSTENSPIQSFTGLQNMSLWDLSLMVYGDISMAYKIVLENNLSSINDLSIAFKSLNFDSNEVKDEALKTIIKKRGYIFASLTEDTDDTNYRVTTSLEIRLTTSNEIRKTNG